MKPSRAKTKVLRKLAPATGAAATRAAEAKKAAAMKKAAPDPMVMASSQGQTANTGKTAGATANSKGPVIGGVASASVSDARATKSDVRPVGASGARVARADAGSGKAQGAGGDHQVVPPPPEEEQAATGGAVSLVKTRERRTKAVRDPARPTERDEPVEETP
jgi:hypothetical protein